MIGGGLAGQIVGFWCRNMGSLGHLGIEIREIDIRGRWQTKFNDLS